jgi:nucleoside-diphosphate-sugar epimerase
MVQTILLTGSSGTVGTALARRLIDEGHRLIPVDIRPCVWDSEIDGRTERRDLRKPIKDLSTRSKPDMIIHLAANARVHELVVEPGRALDNYVMTHNVLEYARQHGISRILFSSSREIYGESQSRKRRRESDTDVTRIKSPYTASKFSAEALLHAYQACYDIRSTIVRLSNVYGKYDVSERVIPLFIYYAIRNRPLTVFGKDKRLDFTYVDDCIDGLTRIVDRFDRVQGRTFNIASGRGETLVNLARWVIDEVGSASSIQFDSKRTGEISCFTADISQARKLLGYKPATTLKDGLGRAVRWYCEAVKDRRIYDLHRRTLKRWNWQ